MKTLILTGTTRLLTTGLAGASNACADTAPHSEPMCRFGEAQQVTPIHQIIENGVPEQRCWKLYRVIPAAGRAGTDRAARAWTRRCSPVEGRESRQAVAASRVKYHYRGCIFQARTARPPGLQVRVDHRFEPVHC